MTITSKDYLKGLTILTSVLIVTTVTFGAVAFYVREKNPSSQAPLEFFTYLTVFFVIAGFVASNLTYKTLMSSAKSAPSLKEKLGKYKLALLIRTACLEIPGVFGAAAVIITGEIRFLLAIIAVVPIMIYFRPTIASIVNDLVLPDQEKMLLENPDAVLYTVEVATDS